jgi:hypothetical protein
MKKKRLSVSMCIAVLAIVTSVAAVNAAEYEPANNRNGLGIVRVVINGKALDTETPPVIMNDRVLAPLRAVGEALDYEILWNESDKSIIVSGKDFINVL